LEASKLDGAENSGFDIKGIGSPTEMKVLPWLQNNFPLTQPHLFVAIAVGAL